MKIPARNIVLSAFLTMAVGLFMTVFVQNAKAQSAVSVSGTTWVGTDSDGDYYEYSFQADGALYYKSPSGFWTNGTWKQDGDSIYMETNNKYSEYQGRISGTHMEGRAWNVKDKHWTWVADLRNTPPTSANVSVASLAGTSWTVVETDGDRDIFNFLADGTLSYSYQNGSYTNGTWKQDGDSIYIQMNNKYVEYQGRITGTHIEGTASNVKGNHWTWTADLQSATLSGNATQGNSSVASIAGTTWSGPDTMGNHYDYEFRTDGSLRYSYETGSFTDATWKQDGDSIYMSINNKYSERLGRINGSHMQGDAWNVKGQKWTWEADKK
jgi:osmotically-inducible protein OsmY